MKILIIIWIALYILSPRRLYLQCFLYNRVSFVRGPTTPTNKFVRLCTLESLCPGSRLICSISAPAYTSLIICRESCWRNCAWLSGHGPLLTALGPLFVLMIARNGADSDVLSVLLDDFHICLNGFPLNTLIDPFSRIEAHTKGSSLIHIAYIWVDFAWSVAIWIDKFVTIQTFAAYIN